MVVNGASNLIHLELDHLFYVGGGGGGDHIIWWIAFGRWWWNLVEVVMVEETASTYNSPQVAG